jgi:thymidylate kinase
MTEFLNENYPVKKSIRMEGIDSEFINGVKESMQPCEAICEKIDGAILLDVPTEELFERIALRGREDDQDRATIEHRFDIFEENISEMASMFKEKGIDIVKVDGVGAVEEVTNRLVDVVMEMVPGARIQINDVNGEEIERSYGE